MGKGWGEALLVPTLLWGTHLPLMSMADGVAAGGGRESRSSCGNAVGTMTEPGSFPAPVARVPSRLLSWDGKQRHSVTAAPTRRLPAEPCPTLYLCRWVRGHGAAQLEGLAASLRCPSCRGGRGCRCCCALLLLAQAVPLDLLADEQLPEPLALGHRVRSRRTDTGPSAPQGCWFPPRIHFQTQPSPYLPLLLQL